MHEAHTPVEVHDPENPARRAFTVQSILALLGGVTITISACDNGSPTSPGTGGSGGSGGQGTSGSVSANHGHTATVTSAQIMAANAVSLNIRGGATHPHVVELTAVEVGQVGAGQRVSKASTTDDSPDAGRHSHVVTFN